MICFGLLRDMLYFYSEMKNGNGFYRSFLFGFLLKKSNNSFEKD